MKNDVVLYQHCKLGADYYAMEVGVGLGKVFNLCQIMFSNNLSQKG